MSDIVKQMVSNALWGGGSGGGGGGGLPSGGAPHQVLVTDKKGTAGWQDRLCYETQEEMVFLPETVLMDADGMFVGSVPLTEKIVSGNVYPVNYNGGTYSCVAQVFPDDVNCFCFGNMGALAEGFQTTEDPFILIVAQKGENGMMGMEGVYSALIPLDGASKITISIQGIMEQVKKIDAKYAPGYVFGEFPYKDRVFLEETTISGQNVQITFDAPLVPDQIYTVTYNGIAHTIAPEESGVLAHGFTLELIEENGNHVLSIHVPYSNLGMGMLVLENPSTFTLSIVGSGVETVKIPDELLEKPPFVITVAHSTTNEIKSVSATYEEINRAYQAGRSIFCLLTYSSGIGSDHFIPLTQHDGRGFVFQSAPWDAYKYYQLVIDEDGNTLEEITPALDALRITSAGGLTLKASNGTEYQITVSDDGTLSAVPL